MVERATSAENDAGCGHPNHGNPDHDCKPFVSVGHGDQCDGCLMLAMVDRAERAEAEAHNLAHEVDRVRERLWRLAALAGWRSGNPADNDATAELYVTEALQTRPIPPDKQPSEDPPAEAIRSVLREADDTWMSSQSRDLFEQLWDIVGGRVLPPAATCPHCGGRGEVYDGPRIAWKSCPMCVTSPGSPGVAPARGDDR